MPTQIAELIPKLPEPVRALPRTAIWAYGTATAALRPLPTALIIGAQKAGTTALYAWLRDHPAVVGPVWKEVNYFDRRYAKGPRWYRGNFPRARGASVVLEATPGYLFHPQAPQRVRELIPDARLVALVREPVGRAYSHYQHEVALGREPLAFEQAVAAEDERMDGELDRMLADPEYFSHAWWNYTYLARGRYAEQLERWLEVFPEEQLLVIPTEDLTQRPRETYARVLEHVRAAAHDLGEYPRVYAREYDEMSPETRARLKGKFTESNRRLYELLGRDLGWT